MGYNTTYGLMILDEDKCDEAAVFNRVVEVSEYTHWDDYYLSSCKWYDWEDNMRQVSAEFPGVLMRLSGEGEESGDLWHAYFKDGKCQVCTAEVVYPAYDESKLK